MIPLIAVKIGKASDSEGIPFSTVGITKKLNKGDVYRYDPPVEFDKYDKNSILLAVSPFMVDGEEKVLKLEMDL